jgi:hypothetical protein
VIVVWLVATGLAGCLVVAAGERDGGRVVVELVQVDVEFVDRGEDGPGDQTARSASKSRSNIRPVRSSFNASTSAAFSPKSAGSNGAAHFAQRVDRLVVDTQVPDQQSDHHSRVKTQPGVIGREEPVDDRVEAEPVKETVDDRNGPQRFGRQPELVCHLFDHPRLDTCSTVILLSNPTGDGGYREGNPVGPNSDQQREHQRIIDAIGEIDFVAPGTITRRDTSCGKPNCKCQADPPQLQRPLHLLDPQSEQQDRHPAPHRRPTRRLPALLDNNRRLRDLTRQLQALTLDIIDNDDRWDT